MRAAAAGEGGAAGFFPDELATIRRSLQAGALLEDADFPLALKILRDFCTRRAVGPEDWLVLNGLPRHAGQAAMLETAARVEMVVILEAAAEVVRERIRLDTGGDRAGRSDDDLAAVERKLEIFRARTLPLVSYYGARGAAVMRVPVTPASSAEEMWDVLARSV
jgi:adenylate kinase family enzyme